MIVKLPSDLDGMELLVRTRDRWYYAEVRVGTSSLFFLRRLIKWVPALTLRLG
jgi:hypothetical protein